MTSLALERALPWLALLLTPLAGLSWSRGYVLPRVECASLTLALVAVASFGMLAHHVLWPRTGDGAERTARPGVFQLLFFGQYAVLLASTVIAPFAALFAELTGKHISLRLTLPLVLVLSWALTLLRRRKAQQAGAPLSPLVLPPAFSLYLAALALLALFRALILHSFHAGPIGHDTQSHIYWAEQVADYGYINFTSRNSDLLLAYPRHFHLLAAGWNALGLFGPIGPYVKLMPTLQALITCGFFAELMLAKLRSEHRSEPLLATAFAGMFLCWHLILGDGASVYPLPDLSGTPRFSAGWVTFCPLLLATAHLVGTVRDARQLLVASLPVLLALGTNINPTTPYFLLVFAVPVTALLFYLGTRGTDLPRVPLLRPLLWSSLFAGVVWFTSPGSLGFGFAGMKPVANALHWLGVRTVSATIPGEYWTEPAGGFGALCPRGLAECAGEVTSNVLAGAALSYKEAVLSADLPGVDANHDSWYWLVFSLPLLIAAFSITRNESQPPFSKSASKLFIALVAGFVLAGPPIALLALSAVQSLSVLGPFVGLFVAYVSPQQMYLSTWVLCAGALCSWCLLPSLTVRARWGNACFAATALLVYTMLGRYAPEELLNHRSAVHGRGIDWPELKAIDALNKFVPESEGILIGAIHVHVNDREHILFVDSPEGSVMPYLETRTLFGLGLGSSADYGWRDMEQRLCQAPKEERFRLLRETNTRWVLVRGIERNRDAFKAYRFPCGLGLTDVGAVYPPVWRKKDLMLFRIYPW